jgi:hypothetical protein
MTEKNSLTLFDQIPTEILFEIFDYLSCNDIFYTFFYFNQRFNSILLENQRFSNNFQSPITNFRFWENILPIIKSQVQCLTLTTIDFCSSLDLFPNLKCLIISFPIPIDYEELTLILKSEQFKKLNSFKIQNEIFFKEEETLLVDIFHHENSLQIFEYSSALSSREMSNLPININIQSLSLKLTNFVPIVSLLDYTPNLKYLNLLVRTFWHVDISDRKVDLSKIKLKQIFFTLENGEIKERSFLVLTNFLKQFSSSLICLSLNLNQIGTNEQFQFNGITLQQQLLNSMVQLKTFHLYAQFDQEPVDVEHLLSTFENRFWLSRQWSIGIYGKYLYTLPFHFDKLEDFIDFDHIKSKISTWSRVTSMNLSKYADLNSNFTKQLKVKMPNLRSITFNFEPMNDLYTNAIDTTLDSVTTVHCEGEYLQNIKQWLINILPNVKHLVLSYSPQPTASSSKRTVFIQKLDAYFRGERMTRDYIYFSHIQSVEIKLELKDLDDLYKHVLRLIRELLEMCKNLQYFIFQFYSIDRYSRSEPFTYLTKMIQLLNMDKISKKYQIKHIQNYFQFIKKEQ